MQPTFEQVIEMVSLLPDSELERLGEWIRERQRECVSEGLQGDEDVRGRRMEWLKANREGYGGQVCCS